MASDYALCVVNDILYIMNKKGDSQVRENVIESIIDRVSSKIENYCDRHFITRGTLTEYYDGSGTNKLYLKQYPITSVSGIYIDSDWSWGSTTELSSTSYRVAENERYVVANTDIFTKDDQNIKVVYAAGYADVDAVPDDLKHACISEVVRIYQQSFEGALGKTSGLDYSYIIDPFLPETKETLDRHKKVSAC